MSLLDADDEETQFSSSLMNVRQQSHELEVEKQEDILQNLQVDHNLSEMVSKPTFNVQAIDRMIQDMQNQVNELREQRNQLGLSMVTICLTQTCSAPSLNGRRSKHSLFNVLEVLKTLHSL